MELEIPRTYSVALLHHALDGDASQYFDSFLDGQVFEIPAAYDLLDKKFNTANRQRHVRRTMQALRPHHYQDEKVGKDAVLSLTKADIDRLSKQGETCYDFDRSRCDTMAEHVLRFEHTWAWD